MGWIRDFSRELEGVEETVQDFASTGGTVGDGVFGKVPARFGVGSDIAGTAIEVADGRRSAKMTEEGYFNE